MMLGHSENARRDTSVAGDPERFGSYLRQLRQAAGLTLRDLGERLGVSKGHCAHIELGGRSPLSPEAWQPLLAIGADEGTLLRLAERHRSKRLARTEGFRSTAGRRSRPAGHAHSASWNELAWEGDDWCWYVVAHHPDGIDAEQVGELMGLSAERVRQIEQDACAKLRANAEVVDALQTGAAPIW